MGTVRGMNFLRVGRSDASNGTRSNDRSVRIEERSLRNSLYGVGLRRYGSIFFFVVAERSVINRAGIEVASSVISIVFMNFVCNFVRVWSTTGLDESSDYVKVIAGEFVSFPKVAAANSWYPSTSVTLRNRNAKDRQIEESCAVLEESV